MKTLKRLLTVVLAFVMSLTVAVFSACNFTSGNNGDNGDKGNNGENGDNGNNGGNGGDDVTAEYVGSTEEITALVNAMLTQKVEYAGMTMAARESQNATAYRIDANGNKLPNASDDGAYTTKNNTDVSAKFNIKAGDGDISVKDESKYRYDEEENISYSYTFLRDWNMFSYSERDQETGESVPVTNFTGKTLYWGGDMIDMMSYNGVPGIDAILGDVSYGEYVGSLLVPAYGASVAALADQLGAFTIEGNKATADLNKAAYNLIQKVNAVLNKVDENTTVGDFLAFDEVKGIITALTSGLTGAQIKAYALQIISAMGDIPVQDGVTINQMLAGFQIDISKLFVEPAEGDTAYDYIVKLISSNELKNTINAVLTAVQMAANPQATNIITLPTNINNMTIDWFLNLAGVNIAQIKSIIGSYTAGTSATELKINTSSSAIEVTLRYYDEEKNEECEKTFTVPFAIHNNITITNLKVEYTLDGNKVTGQKIGVNVSRNFKDDNGSSSSSSSGVQYVNIAEGTETVSVNMSLNYSAEAYELANISSNPVIYSRSEWLANKTYSDDVYIHINRETMRGLGIGEEYEGVEIADYMATANIVDGEYKGFTLSDDQGKKVTLDKNSFQIPVKPYKYGDEGIEYGAPVNVTVDMDIHQSSSVHIELSVNGEDCGYIGFYQDDVYYQNTVSKLLVGGHASSTKFDPMAG